MHQKSDCEFAQSKRQGVAVLLFKAKQAVPQSFYLALKLSVRVSDTVQKFALSSALSLKDFNLSAILIKLNKATNYMVLSLILATCLDYIGCTL